MSSITTILGTDLLSASRAVINTNFSNLNTDKTESSFVSANFLSKPVDASTLASGTPDTTTFLRGDMSWQAPAVAATAKTLIPLSPLLIDPGATVPDANVNITNNAQIRIGQVVVPLGMTVNKVSLNIVTTNEPGSLQFTLYNDSGSASVFTTSTAAMIVSPASTQGILTTIVPSLALSAGVYYAGLNPNGTASAGVSGWDTDNGAVIIRFRGSVATSAVIEGVYSIAASTPPASIQVRSLGPEENNTIIFRLDN